ncbi:hypothetical protein C8Q74DRAFT_1298169 [Fomes fomentarius]|nr:hypothetical protein C8Q74DRAFT_1298169 [Fomes fomentarius]
MVGQSPRCRPALAVHPAHLHGHACISPRRTQTYLRSLSNHNTLSLPVYEPPCQSHMFVNLNHAPFVVRAFVPPCTPGCHTVHASLLVLPMHTRHT